MKRKLLTFIVILCTFFVQQNANAQTILAPGDIAFIGYQTGTANDGFSFITLKDMTLGTVLFLTEKGWGNGTWAGSTTEPHLRWTVPAFTPAGTIISIIETATDDVFTITGTAQSSVVIVQSVNFNLSGGDQILAYQSATGPEPASPTFIAAIHGDYNLNDYDPLTTWNTAVGASGGNESSLPPGLVNGETCISLFPAPGPELANSKYNGTLTGTVANLLLSINNPANWLHNPAATPTLDLGIIPTNYPVPAVSTVIVATVTTTTATSVKAVSALMGGNVSLNGGDAMVQKGIVWATTASPTIADHKIQNGTGTGSFSATITGLPSGTTIHYRAYATNSAGTSYGAELTFNTGAGLSTTATPQVNVLCNGAPTGSASVTVTGGTLNYSYSWLPSGGTGATASNLTAGNYTVTITDGEGTQITRPFLITQPPVLDGTPSTSAVACFGLPTGVASITANGGAGGYTYLWSNGATTSGISGLASGTYSVTITDGNLCTKTISNINVGGPTTALTATSSTTPVSCFNGSNGTATVTAVGGTGTKTYLWSNGATSTTATGLLAGTYNVTVRDANLCSTIVTGIVVEGPTAAVSGTVATTPVSCFGGSNGSATVTPSGGVGGYTYSWSPSGGTGATASGLTAGTYSVTITDNNGCPSTITGITVDGPVAGLSGIASTTAVSCFGASNGSATITVSGGTGTKTYLWSNGATGATASGLATGIYSVTVTDANACSRTFNNISVGSVTAINPTPTQVNVSCNGGANGSATVTPIGGSGTYSYLWTNGATTPTISNLTQGNYSVTITDSFSCSVTQAFTITEPPALVASQDAVINPSCNIGGNGSATVAVTGGTLPYTYSWSPSGGTGITASGLSDGTYTVTVTDGKGCTATQSFTLVKPTSLAVTTSQNDILCNGDATGSASVIVTGGTPGYTYSWTPSGGTAATASNLIAGTYTVTITDKNNCFTTRIFIITQPLTPLTAFQGTTVNVNCHGDTTGSATVNVTGGTGSYSYSWAPSGGTGTTASGLSAGNYTATIFDDNGCMTSQNFSISQPAAALSATTASTGVSCFGGSNGTASVTVSGGTPNYSYSWTPSGGTAAFATGLSAGNYTCTITDSKGCILIQPVTVGSPSALSPTIAKTDVSCNGGTNGTATVTVSGGVGSYTYLWLPTGGNAATASGLSQGTYTVTIQDGNTCTTTASITIYEPTPLMSSITKTDVLCNGGATGTATVAPLGGNGNYTYEWSPSGGTAPTATGLTIGTYTCKITDAKGCFVSNSITIGQPATLSATTSQIDATCLLPGQASVTVSGGVSPYFYSWSSGQTTAIITGIAAGNYSVIITDANGCTITKNFTINTTNTLVATTSQTDVFCNGSDTGSATVVPSGAPGPFTYVWSPSGGSADTASNLTAGNYSVTITSSNGCSTVKNFTITEPTVIVVTPSQINLTCNGGTNGSASVIVTGGTGAYTYSWFPTGGTAATATGLTAGTYTVTVKDANLCQTTQTFTITEPAAFTATTTTTNVNCNGANNGAATVTATGGTGAYTYLWSPTGGSADTATGLSPGNYTVTITDANNCSTTENVSITEPAQLTAAVTQTNVTCIGSADGSATVTATGGTGTYSYAWSPSGGTAATATGLAAGNYTATITDANGCQITNSVTIITTPDVTAPVSDVTNLPDITSTCSILSSQIPVPTATDNCAGIINGTTTAPLNYNAVGSYIIKWSYDDGQGNISTQNQTINVIASPLSQVTFSDSAFTYDGNIHELKVANLPVGANVTYSVTPTASSQNGATNAGVYTVTAIVSPLASTPNCSAVTLTAQLTINKAAQQITFDAIPAKILGAIKDFNLEATANSGLPVRYSFTYTSALPPANVSAIGLVNMLRSGDLLITAHQDGNDNFLAAQAVDQLLVIKNNDITIAKIIIGNKDYQNPAKEITYVMSCDENNVNVAILNETSAIITPSANFTITTPKPGIYTQNVVVTSQDGTATANYTLTVEKPFGFYDIVRQKFNNVLIVNNNPQTNGGYEFVSYQWFKNGQQIGTGQYYTAGDSEGNTLDPSADYSAKMTTKDGKVLATCSAKITTQKSVAAKLYPNPIQAGKVITVEADFPKEELANMQISLYSVSGQLIKTLKSSSVLTEVQLPDAESNMYVVVIETANIKKTLKVIVNK